MPCTIAGVLPMMDPDTDLPQVALPAPADGLVRSPYQGPSGGLMSGKAACGRAAQAPWPRRRRAHGQAPPGGAPGDAARPHRARHRPWRSQSRALDATINRPLAHQVHIHAMGQRDGRHRWAGLLALGQDVHLGLCAVSAPLLRGCPPVRMDRRHRSLQQRNICAPGGQPHPPPVVAVRSGACHGPATPHPQGRQTGQPQCPGLGFGHRRRGGQQRVAQRGQAPMHNAPASGALRCVAARAAGRSGPVSPACGAGCSGPARPGRPASGPGSRAQGRGRSSAPRRTNTPRPASHRQPSCPAPESSSRLQPGC